MQQESDDFVDSAVPREGTRTVVVEVGSTIVYRFGRRGTNRVSEPAPVGGWRESGTYE